VNGGESGETSAGALRRLAWILQPDVKVLVVETGANDGLRGLDPDSTRANLAAIVRRARAADPGLRIVLAGMEAPPNLGAAYTARFRGIFRDLARRERLALIPFILQGVGGVDSLNQGDGIHPNAAGARLVAENVWGALEPVLREGYRGTGVPAHRNRP
jgi:acyl-CoA thioesterase I